MSIFRAAFRRKPTAHQVTRLRETHMNRRTANIPTLLIIAMSALLIACDSGPQEPPVSAVERGASLFGENCTPCHGQAGRGPKMSEIRALSPEGLRAAIKNHPTAGQIPSRLHDIFVD